MPLTDAFGRAWAHKTTVKVGDVLECDGDFTCIAKGDRRRVKRWDGDRSGHDLEYSKTPFARLYIRCGDGKHFLHGQEGDDGELVGLYSVSN